MVSPDIHYGRHILCNHPLDYTLRRIVSPLMLLGQKRVSPHFIVAAKRQVARYPDRMNSPQPTVRSRLERWF